MNSKSISWFILGSLVLLACLLLRTSGARYSDQDRATLLGGSSIAHPAGTDVLGRDRSVRVAAAFLIGLGGALAAAALTTAAAAAIGTMAAFGSPGLTRLTMLACDVFLALPWLFLLMMVRSALPLTTSPSRSASLTFLVLAALGWPALARAIYRGALDLRRADWMLHAHASGLKDGQLIRYLLPSMLPLLIPQFLISIPAFVVAEANLGALGLSVGEPLPSWGGMLLELDNSSLLIKTNWVYLPIGLLMLTLVLLDAAAEEN